MRSSVRRIALFGIYAGLMFALQIVMGPLPNIEPVSLMIIALSTVYGLKALWSVFVFILLEGLLYGFGLWWFFYLYAWPILTVLTVVFKKAIGNAPLGYALLSGGYGLFFGFLYALIYLFSGGLNTFLACWAAGLTFDLIHCVSNFVIALVLTKPLVGLLEKARLQRFV